MKLSAVYILSIIVANVVIARFGPVASPYVALMFVGLTISTRDRLHVAWGARVVPRMFALIVTAGALSFLIQREAGVIALASVAAFVISEVVDAMIFAKMRGAYLQRSLTSNFFGALIDTAVFFLIAFPDALFVIGPVQFLLKFLGGALYALAFARSLR